MDNEEFLGKILKQCLTESIEEYLDMPSDQYQDWSNGINDVFKKWYLPNNSDRHAHGINPGRGKFPNVDGGHIFVYHACNIGSLVELDRYGKPKTDENGDVIPTGILKDGFSRRYLGKFCMCLGSGIYTTITPTNDTYESSFGYAMVKCILVNGLKDFIIFDRELREKYDPGSTLEDEMRRFMTPQQISELMRSVRGLSGYGNGSGVYGGSRREVGDFVKNLSGRSFRSMYDDPARRIPDASNDVKEEDRINKTKLRGFVYHDGYGEVVLVRDINSLIPYQYMLNRDNDHWHYAPTNKKEIFDKINNSTDVYWKFSGKYPKTPYYATSTNGYSLVSDDNGDYLVNDRTEEPIFDFPIKGLKKLNSLNNTTDFTYGGKHYLLYFMKDKPFIRELKTDANGEENPTGLPMNPMMFKKKNGIQ